MLPSCGSSVVQDTIAVVAWCAASTSSSSTRSDPTWRPPVPCGYAVSDVMQITDPRMMVAAATAGKVRGYG